MKVFSLYASFYPIGGREREWNLFFIGLWKKTFFYWLEKKETVSLSVLEH